MDEEKRKRCYTKGSTNRKFTVISETNKILYVGDVNDICAKYSVDRNSVYQASYGKFKLKGKYTVRESTEEESKLEYPHYFKAIIVKSKAQLRNEERDNFIKEENWIEEPTTHIKKPYRSSSGHRFTPL